MHGNKEYRRSRDEPHHKRLSEKDNKEETSNRDPYNRDPLYEYKITSRQEILEKYRRIQKISQSQTRITKPEKHGTSEDDYSDYLRDYKDPSKKRAYEELSSPINVHTKPELIYDFDKKCWVEKQDQSPQSPNRKSPHEEQQQWQKYLKREKNESLQDKQTLFSDEQKHKQMYMNITSKEKETFPHGVEEQILREQNENKLKDTTPAHTQEHIGKEREQDKLSEQYDIDKDVEMADVTQSEVNEGEKKEDRSSTYNLTMTDRTSSQRTNVQEFSIQKEETPDIPFIKPRITMKAFAKEYKNETTKRNIDRMRKKGYYWIVGTRGDGNCFYRAVVFQFFRWLLKHSRDGTSVLEIFKNFELFPTIRNFLTKMNETQMLSEMITQLSNCRKALERFDKIENEVEFMEWMNDKIYSNAVVYLMRLIAAYELICDPETYRYFIPREDFNAYVLQNVIKMGEEAGDVEITAIGTSMKKNLVLDPFLLDGFYPELRIVYLDRNERELPEYNYPLCTPKDMEPETLTLLFRPGHYDVIL